MGDAVRRYVFTVADYHRMGVSGIFADGARVELLGGEVVEVSPMGSRHGGSITMLNHVFSKLCAGNALVQVQVPVVLDDYSEPEPDIALLRILRPGENAVLPIPGEPSCADADLFPPPPAA